VKIFDTNKLIKQWRQSRKRPLVEYGRADVEGWAQELIRIYQTNYIADRHEMELAKLFLGTFVILDGGIIRPEDWTKARQLAERIPPDGRSRGAIDCLIKAITIRLRCDILTDDGGMPRHP
jgi:predicted nucleic acid-binding protein